VSLFGGALTILFILFMALYLTVDREDMLEYAIVLVPEQRQEQARRIVSHISARLSAWAIGPFISAVPSILLGFAVSPTVGLLATAFSIIWSQVANNVVLPRVMSTAVKLNPLIVLLSLLVGGELMGLIGALISIPAAAAIAVVIDEIRRERLETLQSARAVALGQPASQAT
jgi:predicted PurR-regulated permease PerM